MDAVTALGALYVLVPEGWTQTRLAERLDWFKVVSSALTARDLHDAEMIDVAPQIIDKILARLDAGASMLSADARAAREMEEIADLHRGLRGLLHLG